MNLRRKFWPSFRTGIVFRCLLTLVALFYVVQHLSAVAHFALVRHAVCDEHGELVDVDASTSAAPANQARPRSETGSQGPASPSDHGHEHCGVLAHLRPHLSAAVFAAMPGRAAVPEVIVASHERLPAALAIPIYQLAPKNSPPA